MIKSKLYLLFLISIISTSCYSQDNKSFSSFIKNFKQCKLPINGDEIPSVSEISEQDFINFVKDEGDWTYGEKYHYSTAFTFSLDNGVVATICNLCYYPEDIGLEKKEVVLSTYQSNGKKVNSLVIDGYHGDLYYLNGVISEDYIITISRYEMVWNNNLEEYNEQIKEKRYKLLKNDGRIVFLEEKLVTSH
nr:hypothetical protein [uncultured Marinifilum sp.]